MRNAELILKHCFAPIEFKKLHEFRALRTFVLALPLTLRKGILFYYLRDGIIFFALNHPAFKQEFYHKKQFINSCLGDYKQLLTSRAEELQALSETEISAINDVLNATEVRYFLSEKYEKSPKEPPREIEFYYELADGEFENLAIDPKLHAIFEDIRECILRNKGC